MAQHVLDWQQACETGADFDGFGWGDTWPEDAWVRVTQAGAAHILRCRDLLARAPAMPGTVPQIRFNLHGADLVDARFINMPGLDGCSEVPMDTTILVIEPDGFQILGRKSNGAEARTDLIPFDKLGQVDQAVLENRAEPAMILVRQISRMTMDGEIVDGREFVMENDDAVSTLNGLIEAARGVEWAQQSARKTDNLRPRMGG